MTPAIKQQYEAIHNGIQFLPVIIDAAGGAESLEAFLRDARKYADGTMDAIIPHFMSISDMRTTQKNLTQAMEVASALLKLHRLIVKGMADEQAA